MDSENQEGYPLKKLVPAAIGAWVGYLVIDFLTHAVFLANWWRATETYWLTPSELFQRIPFGYTSFAIYCIVLTWLINRLYRNQVNLTRGVRFGAIAGMVSGIASVLGNYSAFRMPPSALIVWPMSIMLDSAVAGGIIVWVMTADHPWKQVVKVFGWMLLFFILGVVIQNIFFPTPVSHLTK
jgi:hypothetical protein